MFKSSHYITEYECTVFVTDVGDAISMFKLSSDYHSDREYTVLFNNETNTFDIYQLI